MSQPCRRSTARLRNNLRSLERMRLALWVYLAAVAVVLLLRFAVEGLGLGLTTGWGIGIVSATTDVVGPFYHLFGTHPLCDLVAGMGYAAAAQLVLGVRLPNWSSSGLPAALLDQ